MSAPITSQIGWRGVTIRIVFWKRRWKSDFDHLEIAAMNDAPIPITETGYRSYFLPDGVVEEHGGQEAYVLTWLDHEADSEAWKKREEASRQMSLFWSASYLAGFRPISSDTGHSMGMISAEK